MNLKVSWIREASAGLLCLNADALFNTESLAMITKTVLHLSFDLFKGH